MYKQGLRSRFCGRLPATKVHDGHNLRIGVVLKGINFYDLTNVMEFTCKCQTHCVQSNFRNEIAYDTIVIRIINQDQLSLSPELSLY